MIQSRVLITALACVSLISCKHASVPEPAYNTSEPSAKLEDFFWPAANGAEYHPKAHRPPPFWPPHEHQADIPPDAHIIKFPFTPTVN